MKKKLTPVAQPTSVEMQMIYDRLEYLELQLSMITTCIKELHAAIKTLQKTKASNL